MAKKRWVDLNGDDVTTTGPGKGRPAGVGNEPKFCSLEHPTPMKAIWRVGKRGFCMGHKTEAIAAARGKAAAAEAV